MTVQFSRSAEKAPVGIRPVGLSKLNSMRASSVVPADTPEGVPRDQRRGALPDSVDVRNPIEGEMRAA
jgi:hypothetical protein